MVPAEFEPESGVQLLTVGAPLGGILSPRLCRTARPYNHGQNLAGRTICWTNSLRELVEAVASNIGLRYSGQQIVLFRRGGVCNAFTAETSSLPRSPVLGQSGTSLGAVTDMHAVGGKRDSHELLLRIMGF